MRKTFAKTPIAQFALTVVVGVGFFSLISAAQAPVGPTSSAGPNVPAAPASALPAVAAPAGKGQTADAFPALSAIQADHVSLSVQNLDREIEWYGRMLGFKVTKRNDRPDMTNVNLSNGYYRIDLIKYPGSKRTPADPVYLSQGYVHLALSVPDIPAARAALMALDPDMKAGSGAAIVLRDPEGNEIEIFARK